MYIVLGASGNIGSAVVNHLSATREKVIGVLHSRGHANDLSRKNVEPVMVDVNDVDALRAVLKRGTRALLLNPPAAPSSDTNAVELASARSIAAALENSGLEKVVVVSTYGAQPGDGIGDLSVLYEFEQLVEATGIPAAINRGAYYFTNLDMLLDPAASGTLPTAFPAEMKLPMVSPADLGKAAAERVMSPVDDVGIQYVEGPARYSFNDVAAVVAKRVGKPVKVARTPRDQWVESFKSVGFSPEAAKAYARMTGATIDNPQTPDEPQRGTVTLEDYVAGLK